MEKLLETRDFLDLSVYIRGKNEMPPQWFYWAATSFLAALVEDRVQLPKGRRSVMYPNLYVFLVGESGGGKGDTINETVEMLAKHPKEALRHRIRILNARLTAQALLDVLAGKKGVQGGTAGVSNIYFLTEELKQSLRSGDMTEDLLANLTKLWAQDPLPVEDITRYGPEVCFEDACINWLAGSTPDWFRKSVTPSSVAGGFFARVLPVFGERDYSTRYPNIIYPEDVEEVDAHLAERIEGYLDLNSGVIRGEPLHFSKTARELKDEWYCTRAIPERDMRPFANRADTMVKKLAALYMLAEWDCTVSANGCSNVIERRHLQKAINVWNHHEAQLPFLLNLVSLTPSTENVEILAERIRDWREIQHSVALKRLHNKGFDAKLFAAAIQTLTDRQDVEIWHDAGHRGAKMYRWIGT